MRNSRKFQITRRSITYIVILALVVLILIIELSKLAEQYSTEIYQPTAKKGVLDLSDWDLDANPILSLDGEWEFYYKQLFTTVSFHSSDCDYIKAPGLWNSHILSDKKIGPYGYATYRLMLLLPHGNNQRLALKIPDMSSSYQLFINGQLISSNGTVGTSYKEEVPSWQPLVRTIGVEAGPMELILQISNYHHMKGGMWEPILLGQENAIVRNRELNLFTSVLLMGVLVISALYYFIFYSVMDKNVVSLYLALFCLAAATREFLIREVLVKLIFPEFPFQLLSRLEYMTVPSGPILSALCLYGLYPEVFPKKMLRNILAPFLLYLVIIAVTPLYLFGYLMNPCLILFILAFIYLISIIIKAIRRKKAGAGLLLFGTSIMLITAVNDMGYASSIHYNYSLAYTFSIGFIIFILCQMNSFSLIIAEMHERSQRLTKVEMAFLQAQIVPHFLYNTLNTIIYLTREAPDKARSLLLEFSNYLRGKFNFKMYQQNLLVTLEHELGLVKSYLAIEAVRLQGKLEVNYQIDNTILSCNIMPFLLQPLVENAIRHGFKNKTEKCIVTISGNLQKDLLTISIEDNGCGMPKEIILSVLRGGISHRGTGLSNVQQRLISTYGSGMEITSSPNSGTLIIIKIPVTGGTNHAESNAD